jgi:hypothetical protein
MGTTQTKKSEVSFSHLNQRVAEWNETDKANTHLMEEYMKNMYSRGEEERGAISYAE